MRVEITGHASYVFLDIASFTQGRSVEAQQDIIGVLNNIIRESMKGMPNPMPKDQVMFLPTGDGVCIALLSVQARFDLHLNTALDILERLETYNNETKDVLRKFQVRIGLNSNVDNFILDINGNKNVAGAGINYAQRLMGLADPGQIMVSDSDHQILRQREKYMKAFRGYSTEVKHGQRIRAYQYIGRNHEGMNVDVPIRFRKPIEKRRRLSKFEAYYIAHSYRNRELFITKKIADSGGNAYATVLLWNLAKESTIVADTKEHESVSTRIMLNAMISKPTSERYQFYETQDYWLCCDLVSFLTDTKLSYIRNFFEDDTFDSAVYVTDAGVVRLKEDWPDIWEELCLEGNDPPPKEK